MTGLLITDDHPAYVLGLETLLKQHFPALDIFTTNHLDSAKLCLRRNPTINIMLLDRTLPGIDSLQHLHELWVLNPSLRITIISGADSHHHIYEAIEAKAAGFISKGSSNETVLKAVQCLLEVGFYFPSQLLEIHNTLPITQNNLSAQQLKILALMAQGMSNKDIARSLNILEGTVKQHVYTICKKLEVKNRTQAVCSARMRGIIC